MPTAREDGSWQSLRLCRLLTEWQSAKVTVWMASTMACLCRLQFFANCLAVGKSMALPTAWQSAKSGSRQILLCRLQEIPVGKGTSLPSVEKKQLAKKIAVGKEPVSCSVKMIRFRLFQITHSSRGTAVFPDHTAWLLLLLGNPLMSEQ